MTLRITKAADPIRVERLNVCIYAAPGLGKTTVAFTAEAPLLLDFDQGAHRAANRKDIVRVTSWSDVADMKPEDFAGYKTVVIDTAGRALDHLTADIIRRNAKAGRGGALTLQGYGTLKAEFIAWLKALNSYGLDVLLIAHMDEQRNGDEIIERLDVQGGSKGEIYKAADAMGRMAIRDGKRMLNFSPTDAAFGKNPGQLEPLEVPHPSLNPRFLAEVIESIKDRLNQLTEEQTRAQAELEAWRTRIEAMKTADDFNAAQAEIKTAAPAVRAIYVAEVAQAGFVFDKPSGKYISRAPMAEAA